VNEPYEWNQEYRVQRLAMKPNGGSEVLPWASEQATTSGGHGGERLVRFYGVLRSRKLKRPVCFGHEDGRN
jgi:hypothetical protein